MKEAVEEEKSPVGKAEEIVTREFEGETDKAGTPYIVHLNNVKETVKSWGGDEEAQAAALLHDLIEDIDGWAIEDLRGEFSNKVVKAVEAITKRQGEPYMQYVDRVSGNKLATLVKLADLEDNMRKTKENDADEDEETRIKRLKKYEKAYEKLSS